MVVAWKSIALVKVNPVPALGAFVLARFGNRVAFVPKNFCHGSDLPEGSRLKNVWNAKRRSCINQQRGD